MIMALNLTDEQRKHLTPNQRILEQVWAAEERGDKETARELRKQLVIPAETLMALKKTAGADWIRKRGLRTETADEKYGPGWLDR